MAHSSSAAPLSDILQASRNVDAMMRSLTQSDHLAAIAWLRKTAWPKNIGENGAFFAPFLQVCGISAARCATWKIEAFLAQAMEMQPFLDSLGSWLLTGALLQVPLHRAAEPLRLRALSSRAGEPGFAGAMLIAGMSLMKKHSAEIDLVEAFAAILPKGLFDTPPAQFKILKEWAICSFDENDFVGGEQAIRSLRAQTLATLEAAGAVKPADYWRGVKECVADRNHHAFSAHAALLLLDRLDRRVSDATVAQWRDLSKKAQARAKGAWGTSDSQTLASRLEAILELALLNKELARASAKTVAKSARKKKPGIGADAPSTPNPAGSSGDSEFLSRERKPRRI